MIFVFACVAALQFEQRFASLTTLEPSTLSTDGFSFQFPETPQHLHSAHSLRWNPEHVAAALGERNVPVKRSGSPDFLYFDETSRLSALYSLRAEFETVPMTVSEMWRRIDAAVAQCDTVREWLYFSAKLSNQASLFAQAQSELQRLQVPDYDQVHLWCGGPGATSITHFDEMHNLYFQLHGSKTFILQPPSAHTQLYLYPPHHPASRHSALDQLNASEWQSVAFSRAVQRHALLVQLEAGDVLALPPYWFHRVVAQSNSVSVSLWRKSNEVQNYVRARNLLRRAALPLNEATLLGFISELERVASAPLLREIAELQFAPFARQLGLAKPNDCARAESIPDAGELAEMIVHELNVQREGVSGLLLHKFITNLAMDILAQRYVEFFLCAL
jgi:hypothetical protein